MSETGLGRILEIMLQEPERQKLVTQNSRWSVGDSTRWVKTQLIKSQVIYQVWFSVMTIHRKMHVSKLICAPRTRLLLTTRTAQKGNTPNTGKNWKEGLEKKIVESPQSKVLPKTTLCCLCFNATARVGSSIKTFKTIKTTKAFADPPHHNFPLKMNSHSTKWCSDQEQDPQKQGKIYCVISMHAMFSCTKCHLNTESSRCSTQLQSALPTHPARLSEWLGC